MTAALTIDYGEVLEEDYAEVHATLEHILTKVKNRAEVDATPQQDRALIEARQNIAGGDTHY